MANQAFHKDSFTDQHQTDEMKRLPLLLALLLSCSAPVMAQNANEIRGRGMAKWAYTEIEAHLKNYYAAKDAKDFTLACSELRTMLRLVK